MATEDRLSRKTLDGVIESATHVLPDEVAAASVPALLDATRRRNAELLADAPGYRRRMNRKLFALGVPALALYRTLREDAELPRDQAVALVDRTLIRMYERRLSSPVLRTVASGAFRLKVLRDGIMRAAENLDEPEGFSMRRVPSSDALLAFDVERCPLAKFFAEHEAPEVGPLICKLDDQLAEMLTGVTLERTGTIAAGASRCDFRYRRST